MAKADENNCVLCGHKEVKCPLWSPFHTVMTDENIYQWNGPHSCAFVKCSFVDVLGDWGAILKYHQSQCNTTQGNAWMAGGLTRKANSVSIKTRIPPLSLVVPSWKSFHKWSSLTPIYPSDLILEDTSSRKAFLTTCPTMNLPGQPTCFPVTACTFALDTNVIY